MTAPFVAIVADVHVGNHRVFGGDMEGGLNTRAREVLHTLRAALRKAKEDGAAAFVVAGDLFDDCRPSPQLIAATGEALLSVAPLPIYLLLGNHDAHSDEDGDNALVPLALMPHVSVVERAEVLAFGPTGLVLVPWRAGPAREWVAEALRDATGGGRNVVVSHFGIVDDATPIFLRDSSGALSLAELREIMDVEGTFAWWSGDWHPRAVHREPDGRVIGQVGALVPTGFDNPGSPYGSLVYQPLTPGETHELHELPGPRFLTLDYSRATEAPTEVEVQTALACGLGRDLFVRGRALRDHLHVLRLALAEARGAGLVADFELVAVSAQESREAAREGAEKARSAETLDEAADAYLRGMQLDDETLRDDVVMTVRRYLAAGGA